MGVRARIALGLVLVAVAGAAGTVLVLQEQGRRERASDASLGRVAAIGPAASRRADALDGGYAARTLAANEVAAERQVGAWLERVVDGGRPARTLDVRRVREVTATMGGLLDDVRDARITVDPGDATADPGGRRFEASGDIDLQLGTSANPWRRHTLGVDVTLAPVGADATRRLVRSWRVSDARLDRGGLFHLDDPQVIAGEHVTLVAEASNLDLAESGFEFAEANLDALWQRYRALGGPRRAALFYVASPGEASDVLGVPAPDRRFIAYANGIGDVALLNGVARAATYIDQTATIQHELTHVVTLPFTREAPELFVEGVAVYEEHRAIVADGTHHLVLDELVRAFDGDDVDFERIATMQDSFRTDPAGSAIDYLVAGAAVHVLEEEGGHRTVLALYRRLMDGEPAEQALQATFGFGLDELEQRTRTWARANTAWSG